MPLTPAIRPVTAADVPAVVDLVTRVLAEFGIAFGEGSATDAELARLPAAYVDAGGAFWVAAAEDGQLFGTVGVYPLTPSVLELRKMYLAQAARGLGLGKRLLTTALAHARAAGAHEVVLDTTEEMRDAIVFYERHGFVRDDAQIRGSRCSRGYRLRL